MKKLLLFLLPPVLACLVFFSAMFILSKTDRGKGALQVTATPKTNVYLDGKLIGKTPFCKCNLPDLIPTGDYTIRLVPQDSNLQPFEQKIPINKSVITVVDVSFGENSNNSARIISLNPLTDPNATEIFATSFPDHAKVFLDKNNSGETPVFLKDVTDSDHDILFDKDGYESKVLHVHTVKGYKLSAIAFLAVKADLNATVSATPSPSSGTPGFSLTGNPSVTPTPSIKISVTPEISLTSSATSGTQIIILQTPTGFLHVRATANGYGAIVGNVNPGQTFMLLDEQSGWYQIQLSDGTKGWVSSQYANKQ